MACLSYGNWIIYFAFGMTSSSINIHSLLRSQRSAPEFACQSFILFAVNSHAANEVIQFELNCVSAHSSFGLSQGEVRVGVDWRASGQLIESFEKGWMGGRGEWSTRRHWNSVVGLGLSSSSDWWMAFRALRRCFVRLRGFLNETTGRAIPWQSSPRGFQKIFHKFTSLKFPSNSPPHTRLRTWITLIASKKANSIKIIRNDAMPNNKQVIIRVLMTFAGFLFDARATRKQGSELCHSKCHQTNIGIHKNMKISTKNEANWLVDAIHRFRLSIQFASERRASA